MESFNFIESNLLSEAIIPLKAWIKEEGDVSKEYSKETMDTVRIGYDLACKTYIYLRRIDKLLSGDDGQESYLTGLLDDLKTYQDNGDKAILGDF